MAAVKQLSILALASTVLATPYGHGHAHGHKHLHSTGGAPTGYGSATGTGIPYPYPTGNSTGPWGSTGIPYGTAPVGYGSSSSVANPNTATEYNTQTKTIYQTVYAAQSSTSAAADYVNHAAADSYGTGSADSCAVVTVTATEKVTQYVTEGAAPSSSSSTEGSPVESSFAPAAPGYESSSSTEAVPVETTSTSVYSAPAYSAPAYTPSTEASPETTSKTEEAAASSYVAASSSTAAPTLTASYAVKQEAGASKTASAPASYSSTSSSSSGKRGLAYNDASLTSCFSGAREVSWAYNWGSSSDGLDGDYMFIPTLWGTSDDFVGSWSENAKSAISSGSTHLFSFNEPDHSAQANLGYAAAATAYAQYMNPFKDQAQLCAPSVTNGGGEMGLTWLKNFLGACTDCHIDCINIHWYDSAENTAYFKKHVEEAIELADGKPVYISEFGATGSDDQIKSFLEEVMPWMDSNSNVAGYAYFMVKDGMLVSGTEPSTYGSTYKTYTS